MNILFLLCLVPLVAVSAAPLNEPVLELDGWAYYSNGAITPVQPPEVKRVKQELHEAATFNKKPDLPLSSSGNFEPNTHQVEADLQVFEADPSVDVSDDFFLEIDNDTFLRTIQLRR